MTTNKSTRSWVLREFKEFSCGDKRLDNRFATVATDALENPAVSINQASEDWAATKGAYRLFNNSKFNHSEMFECHQTQTLNRIKKHKGVVIAIQDSSYLDFSNHTTLKGKGPIGTRDQNLTGYVMHSTLAVTSEALPLGLLTHDLWARSEIKKNRNAKNRKLPLEKKESHKWVKALEAIHALKLKDQEIINIADREADFYEYFEAAERLEEKIIIRARYDRQITEEDNDDEENEENKKGMWEFMLKQPVCFKEAVEVSRNHVQIKGKNKSVFKERRTADVEVRMGQVTFNAPSSTKQRTSLTYNLIFVKEVNAPEGTIPLEWMLITNLSALTDHDISRVISYYRLRWMIEEYHKILKTGCGVEKCLLEDTQAMFRYITLFCIIAWRLFWMTRLQRINPEMLCTCLLADIEWKALYCYLYRTKEPPVKIPTIREVIIWIARLGGFLARKGDGEPGIITVWRGWVRLNDIVETYQLFTDMSEGEKWY